MRGRRCDREWPCAVAPAPGRKHQAGDECRRMVGGRSERGSRRTVRAASVVVPFPRNTPGDRLDIARLVPSGHSLLVASVLLVAAVGAYWLALGTPLFEVQRVEVQGVPRDLQRKVHAVADDTLGRSLVAVDAGEVAGSVRALPMVAGVSVDRAFPHTLVVRVAAERPVAVARRRTQAWLVTAGGKVVRRVGPRSELELARLWLPKGVPVAVDSRLPAVYIAATKAVAAAQATGFGHGVKGVRLDRGELAMVLRSGVEIRLGPARDVGLKVAIARRVVRVAGDVTYVDVSVPERPVVG